MHVQIGTHSLIVDGVDLSRQVKAVHADVAAGSRPSVTVELHLPEPDITLEVPGVQITPEQAALLEACGWTRPPVLPEVV